MLRSTLLLTLSSLLTISSAMAQLAGNSAEIAAAYPKTTLDQLNSASMEVRPLISADGTTLYFGRRYDKANVRGTNDQDIYVAYKDTVNNSWSEVKPIDEKFNDKRWNAIASVRPDGKELILFNTYKGTDNVPLVRSFRESSGWTEPEEIKIQGYDNFNQYSDFFLDFDRRVLILAIESYETHGGQDLYVSFPTGSQGWSEPVNMGEVINSKAADFAPFMGSDGRTLFFSSYGHEGHGGSDIYMTVRLDNTWTNWSEPINLGPGINTPEDENYFSIDRKFENMYYTSTKSGTKTGNLVQVDLPDNFTSLNGPVLAKLKRGEIEKIMASGNYKIDPNGRSTNADGETFEGWPVEEPAEEIEVIAVTDRSPIPADTTGIEDATTKETALAEGETTETAEVAVNEEGVAVYEEDGLERYVPEYLVGFEPADEVEDLSPAAVEIRDYLQLNIPGVDLAIRQRDGKTEFKLVQDILFGFNSIYPTFEYEQRLSNIAKALKDRPELNMQIIGHTDNIGTEAVNQRVSQQRVNVVSRYVRDRGISKDRIEVVAAGLEDPVASNESDRGRNLNRRVETIIQYNE